MFSWQFVEPTLPFYAYDELGWSSARFGMAMSGYAVMLLVGETALGHLSDRIGRKPVLIMGLVVHTTQYLALVSSDPFPIDRIGHHPVWAGRGAVHASIERLLHGYHTGRAPGMDHGNPIFGRFARWPYRARIGGSRCSISPTAKLVHVFIFSPSPQHIDRTRHPETSPGNYPL